MSASRSLSKGNPMTDQTSQYVVIDKDGKPVMDDRTGKPREFHTVAYAAGVAKAMWPDQDQDEDRSGKGWDVEPADATS